MGNFFGPKHTLGFKPQAVAGTAETTVTTFLATSKMNMKANPSLISRTAYLGTGKNLPGRAGWIAPSGSASAEVHASQPHPWYWALGAVTTTTPAGTVKLHTITDNDTPVRLTCEGDKVYQKAKQGDAYISKLALAFKVGEIAQLDMDWLALSHTEGATLTSTPAFTTDLLIPNVASISLAGAQSFLVPSGSIEWDGQLVGLPVLTNVSAGQPQVIRRSAAPVITGSLDFIDFPAAELTKMIAGTEFALIVEMKGAVIETTYYKFLRITLPACQYTGGLDAEIGEGMVTGSAQFTAGYDTVTSKQILVEAQNTIAAINT